VASAITYSIELTDRTGQTSVLPDPLSVNVPFIPSAPVLVTATEGDREVRLTWTRPFLDMHGGKLRSFDGYHIYRSTTPGQYAEAPLATLVVNTTSFVDADVVNGTTYYYVVQAVAAVTNTLVVGERSLEVAATPNDTDPPDAPVNVTSAYLADMVKLLWNFTASPDWQGFHVYRSLSANGPFEQINAQPVRQPAYDDTTVLPEQEYFYYITSFDTANPPNESQPSEVVRVRTLRR
jgi:fibronectin type 3 domain-containing protein